MNPKHLSILLFVLVSLQFAPAQTMNRKGFSGQIEPRTGQLEIAEIIKTDEVAPTIVLPPKIDLQGNIYVRVQEAEKIGGGPVIRISPDGKKLVRFSLSAVTDLPDGRILDFAPGSPGNFIFSFLSKKQLMSTT